MQMDSSRKVQSLQHRHTSLGSNSVAQFIRGHRSSGSDKRPEEHEAIIHIADSTAEDCQPNIQVPCSPARKLDCATYCIICQ